MRNKIIYGIIAISIIGFHVWLYFDRPIPAAESVRKEKEAIIDSLNGEIRTRDLRIAQRDKKLDTLKLEKLALKSTIDKIRETRDVKLAEAKVLDVSGQQKFWDARYPTTDEPKIHLAENQSAPAIDDLINGDAAIEENTQLKAIVETQEQELNLGYETIVDLTANNDNLELAAKQYQDIIKEQDNSLDYKDAELKTQKNQTLLYKITTVAAILGGGYLLIK